MLRARCGDPFLGRSGTLRPRIGFGLGSLNMKAEVLGQDGRSREAQVSCSIFDGRLMNKGKKRLLGLLAMSLGVGYVNSRGIHWVRVWLWEQHAGLCSYRNLS